MYEDPCTGSVRWFWPWTKLFVTTLKTPSACGPPWIGSCLPLRVTYCALPSGSSNGILALRRSVIASPSAVCTRGLAVFSVFGVLTGSAELNGTTQGEATTATGEPGTAELFA